MTILYYTCTGGRHFYQRGVGRASSWTTTGAVTTCWSSIRMRANWHSVPTFKGRGFRANSQTMASLFAVQSPLRNFLWLLRRSPPKPHELSGKRILFYCDNKAVVHILQKGQSRCPHIMTLTCYAFSLCAHYSIEISAVHIPGTQNNRAAALCRFQISCFKHLSPDADPHPTPVPEISLTPFQWRSPTISITVWLLLLKHLQCPTASVLRFLHSPPPTSRACPTHSTHFNCSPLTRPNAPSPSPFQFTLRPFMLFT